MSNKTRIHDLAAEFAIPTDQLLKMLAEMDIHVRSHLSALDGGQVARIRARWERDKRKPAEEEAAAPRRRRTTKKSAPQKAATVEPVARPKRRRRTAAEVAEKQVEQDAEDERKRQETQVKLQVPEPVAGPVEDKKQSFQERAAALFGEEGVSATTKKAEAPLRPEAQPDSVTTPEPASNEAETKQRPQAETKSESGEGEKPRPVKVENQAGQPARPKPVTAGLKPRASAGPKTPTRTTGPKPVASATPGREVKEDRNREAGKKRKKTKRVEVDRNAVQANINKTLATLRGTKTKRGGKRRGDEPTFREVQEQARQEEIEREKTLVRVNEFVTVSELSGTLKVTPTEIVGFCFKNLGMMVTVNQRLDFDQIEVISSEFGYEAVLEAEYSPAETVEREENPEDLLPRPPVVTIMGHVDHGKTSFLDYVRKTNVIAGESGGITQHIGAYHAEVGDGKAITFLDTPGHEAFTAMRARGAQVTDIVVLVVAADDQIMPQTKEAISHAKNAGVPMVVAINKIDLPGANVEKVKQGLLQHGVILEEFGGDTMFAAISAKTGQGVEEILEKILLQAEMLDKKANPARTANGTVVESTLDPGRGPVATVLVQGGTLNVGDDFICGSLSGRVRAMHDERGRPVKTVGPSIPVQILGFTDVPQAGDVFSVVENATEAREIAQKRQRLDREAAHRRTSRGVSLEDLSRQLEAGQIRSLRIIIKADQGGPAEALADAFAHLSTDEVKVEVIHRGIGAVTENDVLLAKASEAIIIGFHVRPDANARAAIEREQVDVRTYRIIYEAVEDVRLALEGLLAPEQREIVLGDAEIIQIFKISGVGTIAGCMVRNGIIRRNARVRVMRDGVEVYGGGLASLKRFKEDVREVRDGLECGMSVENFNDIKVGDNLESYTVEEFARKLESASTRQDT